MELEKHTQKGLRVLRPRRTILGKILQFQHLNMHMDSIPPSNLFHKMTTIRDHAFINILYITTSTGFYIGVDTQILIENVN